MATSIIINRRSIHQAIYFISLSLIAIFLPSSRFLLTASEILLIANWLAEASFKARFRVLMSDRPAIAFILIYLVNVIGLIWSQDPGYGIKSDLLHKLPALFMPLIIATTPVPDRKRIRIILLLFIASVVVISLIGFFGRVLRADPLFREASPFIPGVYLGMMLIIAAFQLPLLVRQITEKKWHLWVSIALSAWLIFFLFYLRALSSVASLAAIAVFIMIILARRLSNPLLKISIPVMFVVVSLLALLPLAGIYKQIHADPGIDLSKLPAFTAMGNPYVHDTVSIITENGNPVYIFLADEELRDAWNERSSMDFDSLDMMGQELKVTLYRYLSSKNLRKDGEGLAGLTDRDISAVEKGTANYLNVNRPGIYVRAYEELMGLLVYSRSSHRETSWGSLTKRIALWKASAEAFKKHPLLGWGTGGILKAMDFGIEETGSDLKGLNMKPHNQYLYILLTLGLAGLLVAGFLYGYFVIKTGAHRSFMFMLFLIMFLVNFLGNNSFESQPGQDLFVFLTLVYAWFYPSLSR
jgi:hypothetical protein